MHHTARREIAVLYGTRPEAVKLAPVVNELKRRGRHTPLVVTSGQHRGMLDQVNRLFEIVPDHDLGLLRRGYSLDDVLVGAIRGFSEYLDAHPVDAVVVQGDTTTAFAGALTAYHRQIPVVHVEAGLRTGDVYSPFPEEGNRKFISAIATRHCAPTARAARNLHLEHVPERDVTVTGNTVIDALMHTASRPVRISDPVVDTALKIGRRVVLVTAHRRESWDDGIAQIAAAVVQVAELFPDVLFVLPLHGNPIVREAIVPAVLDTPNVRLTEPLPYAEFCRVLSRSSVVVTDSGGIQEEAPAFDVPVVITRDTTERPEVVDAGGGVLVGTDAGQIAGTLGALLTDRELHRRMASAPSPFGDGHAAGRVVDVIESMLAGRRTADADAWTAAALAR
ncbi:non-hydrolyzing UDP-N-acetylglucosamine 2-epimerase [Promicromonospora sukumoe]|uniref:non-hydrolyzing UDP-N-acetylglucosamine 2-epimerase n=1 Tax=Promicromonospora sukumoe TaxID=88382 RepID=UPI00037ECE30|nr:UDP-N-acetylglucosamine 2-epimerase (non-hydrolyzing) [Promicromonospora sukumoe]